ncbi:MAG: hypothetical protein AAGI46_09935 [Planctomycetota bacterium]
MIHEPPARPPTRFDADEALVAQLRRRLLREQAEDLRGNDATGTADRPGALPAPVMRRADELLDRLRRVAPSRLVVAGHDADAALLLDERGVAEVEPHYRAGLLTLRLTTGGAL